MKQTNLIPFLKKRKNPDSVEISYKRLSSQQQSPNDDLLQSIDQIRDSVSKNLETSLPEAYIDLTTDSSKPEDNQVSHDNTVLNVSANNVLRQEIDQLFYRNAVASSSADCVRKKGVVASTNSESETRMVIEEAPDDLQHVMNTSPTFSKTTEKRHIKTRKSIARKNVPFILHTINHYDEHLKTCDALNGILEDDSLALLSTWAFLTKPAKKIVCYLYCIRHEESDKIEMKEIETSLSEKGFITLDSEGSLNELKLSDYKEVCVKNKLKTPGSKEKAKQVLSDFGKTTSYITKWFGNDKNRNRDSDISNELKTKIKKNWKLSDHARETINELLILMHLDNIFNMGCSINPTEKKNNRPVITFKPLTITKYYPVDKKMIVDNASIVFQDRNEFCRYLEAYAFSKKYKSLKAEKTVDDSIVLEAYQLYIEITRNKERMSRYMELPLWLRKFTPADIYVDILHDGVSYLKISKQYQKALNVLDSLISQVMFKQDMKAKWYVMKYNILYRLKLFNEAGSTLNEARNADLPEEILNTLRVYSHKLVDKTRINENLLKDIREHAKKATFENMIPNPEYFYQNPIKKGNKKQRRKYDNLWGNEPPVISAEVFCSNKYKEKYNLHIGEHLEHRIVRTIYFLLFWDIIYMKPYNISGIFISHYQKYPLDMLCEKFYTNRKTSIDNFLTVIEKSTADEIVNKMFERWQDSAKYNVPDISRSITWDCIKTVVRLLGTRGLVVICRRLVQNYKYTRYGFPDLTLCSTESIKFREVKTDDKVQENQLQWLLYLNEHNIDATICYLRDRSEQEILDSLREGTEDLLGSSEGESSKEVLVSSDEESSEQVLDDGDGECTEEVTESSEGEDNEEVLDSSEGESTDEVYDISEREGTEETLENSQGDRTVVVLENSQGDGVEEVLENSQGDGTEAVLNSSQGNGTERTIDNGQIPDTEGKSGHVSDTHEASVSPSLEYRTSANNVWPEIKTCDPQQNASHYEPSHPLLPVAQSGQISEALVEFSTNEQILRAQILQKEHISRERRAEALQNLQIQFLKEKHEVEMRILKQNLTKAQANIQHGRL